MAEVEYVDLKDLEKEAKKEKIMSSFIKRIQYESSFCALIRPIFQF